MLNPKLLNLLVCPELKVPLTLADDELIARLNVAIDEGRLHDRQGRLVDQHLDGGLIREGRDYLYPLRDDIPVMLAEESIPLTN